MQIMRVIVVLESEVEGGGGESSQMEEKKKGDDDCFVRRVGRSPRGPGEGSRRKKGGVRD
jgi:hypothetical protein